MGRLARLDADDGGAGQILNLRALRTPAPLVPLLTTFESPVERQAVVCLAEAPSDWAPDRLFSIDYARQPAENAAPSPAETAPVLRLTVLKGAATVETYRLQAPVVPIGRNAEAMDDAGKVRRNDIAFLDAVDGVTETVGRAHAQLRFDYAAGAYRLFDQGSSNGTSIYRNGSTIAVAPNDPRGVRVRSGDEIRVGRAILRVEPER